MVYSKLRNKSRLIPTISLFSKEDVSFKNSVHTVIYVKIYQGIDCK